MFAPLLSLLFVLLFSFKDTVSDDLMGECDVDLNTLDMQEDHEDQEERVFEMMRQGKPAGKTTLLFSRRAVPKGAFAGVLRIGVVQIDGFSDMAGFMDRADPFVMLQVIFVREHVFAHVMKQYFHMFTTNVCHNSSVLAESPIAKKCKN